MNNAAKARIAEAEHERKGREPGFGTAMIAVGVLISCAAVLTGLIFMLMLAIGPTDARQSAADRSSPVAEPQPPVQQVPGAK